MEASAIKQHLRVGGGARHRTPLLRMQSDERLVNLVRRGNHAAFGALVSRYEARLLAFCRHLLRSREDAEDVLQEVFASAFKAMMADERPIRVRPWLYRIARNRCLNHLRRISAIGVDSIEDHFSEHGPSTSETVQRREDLWQLVGDIQELPESQRSALLLREMEALSYEQIADVLDKTIPSVKSLLIRARRSLAESAEARSLSCREACAELDEVSAGVRERPSRVVRRHIASCGRCSELREPEPEHSFAGIRVWLPLGPAFLLKKLSSLPLIHSGRAGSTATAAGAGAAAGPSLLGGSTTAGFISAGIGGVAGKAAVGLTAAALGVAGAVVVDTSAKKTVHPSSQAAQSGDRSAAAPIASAAAAGSRARSARAPARPAKPPTSSSSSSAPRPTTTTASEATARPAAAAKAPAGRSQRQAIITVLPGTTTSVAGATDATANPASPSGPGTSTGPTGPTGSGGAPAGAPLSATGAPPSATTPPGTPGETTATGTGSTPAPPSGSTPAPPTGSTPAPPTGSTPAPPIGSIPAPTTGSTPAPPPTTPSTTPTPAPGTATSSTPDAGTTNPRRAGYS